MLANGTLTTIDPSIPHLWRAARVSIGRLGIITSLTFRIVQNQPVQRTRQGLVFKDLQVQMEALQAQYVAAKAAGGGAELWRVLQPWDEVQVGAHAGSGARFDVSMARGQSYQVCACVL